MFLDDQELEDVVGRLPGIRKGNVVVFGCRSRAGGTERLVLVAETRETDSGTLERLRQKINGFTLHFLVQLIRESYTDAAL